MTCDLLGDPVFGAWVLLDDVDGLIVLLPPAPMSEGCPPASVGTGL